MSDTYSYRDDAEEQPAEKKTISVADYKALVAQKAKGKRPTPADVDDDGRMTLDELQHGLGIAGETAREAETMAEKASADVAALRLSMGEEIRRLRQEVDDLHAALLAIPREPRARKAAKVVPVPTSTFTPTPAWHGGGQPATVQPQRRRPLSKGELRIAIQVWALIGAVGLFALLVVVGSAMNALGL